MIDVSDSDSLEFLYGKVHEDSEDSGEDDDDPKEALTDADIQKRRDWNRQEKFTKCVTCSRKIFNAALGTDEAPLGNRYQCSVCIYGIYEASAKKGKVKETAPAPVSTTVTMWKCNECKKLFTSLAELQKHTAAIHKYKCTTCKLNFSEQTDFEAHMQSHHEKNTYRCHICNRTVTGLSSLREHLVSVHSQIMCSVCSVLFPSKQEFEKHRNIHTRSNILKCCVCDKTFNYNSFSSNQKDYTCITCTFNKQRGLAKM